MQLSLIQKKKKKSSALLQGGEITCLSNISQKAGLGVKDGGNV